MKKVLMVVALMIVLSGCGSSNDESSQKLESKKEEQVSESVSEESKENREESSSDFVDESIESNDEEGTIPVEIGKPFEISDCKITINKLEVIKDTDGNPALLVNYNWENTGKEPSAPIYEVVFTGYQDGVEIDRNPPIVENINFDNVLKNAKPGKTIKDVNEVLKIEDIDQSFELNIIEALSMNYDTFVYTIDDLKALEK